MLASMQRRLYVAAAVAACLVGAAPSAMSQTHEFPNRPMRLVVPFAAGGSTDIVARLLADALHHKLRQPVVVENKPGAGGMLGTELVAHATADGYTLGLGSISSLAVNPVVLKSSRIDPLADLEMVVPLASIASVFSVAPALGVRDFAQFVKSAQSSGDTWTAGSSGVGSIGHVILEAMNAELGLRLRHIPFKGMGPVINSVLAGHTQVLSDQFPSSAPHVQAGRLVPLAVAAQQRLPSLPNVPTLTELGHPQLNALAITWFGLVVPKNTPALVVHRLNTAINQVLTEQGLRERLLAMGVTPMGGSADDLRELAASASAQVKVLVQERGIVDSAD